MPRLNDDQRRRVRDAVNQARSVKTAETIDGVVDAIERIADEHYEGAGFALRTADAFLDSAIVALHASDVPTAMEAVGSAQVAVRAVLNPKEVVDDDVNTPPGGGPLDARTIAVMGDRLGCDQTMFRDTAGALLPAERCADVLFEHVRHLEAPPPPPGGGGPTRDSLHPDGWCTCAGEGACAWCRAHCLMCGARTPCAPDASAFEGHSRTEDTDG